MRGHRDLMFPDVQKDFYGVGIPWQIQHGRRVYCARMMLNKKGPS